MPNSNVDVSMLLPILKKIPLFADLNEEQHKDIIQHIVLMYYPQSYTIFKEGDAGDALYILKSGQVSVIKEPKEEGDLAQKIAEINTGGFFGEMALVSDVPRNATVKATMDSEVFILNKDDFNKLLSENTVLAQQISATVIARLNQNNKQSQ